MTWLYQSQLVETLPEDCVGFVYLITNNLSGRKYIGKKLAKFSRTTLKTVKQKNGIKKKKKVRSTVMAAGFDGGLPKARKSPRTVFADVEQ